MHIDTPAAHRATDREQMASMRERADARAGVPAPLFLAAAMLLLLCMLAVSSAAVELTSSGELASAAEGTRSCGFVKSFLQMDESFGTSPQKPKQRLGECLPPCSQHSSAHAKATSEQTL